MNTISFIFFIGRGTENNVKICMLAHCREEAPRTGAVPISSTVYEIRTLTFLNVLIFVPFRINAPSKDQFHTIHSLQRTILSRKVVPYLRSLLCCLSEFAL